MGNEEKTMKLREILDMPLRDFVIGREKIPTKKVLRKIFGDDVVVLEESLLPYEHLKFIVDDGKEVEIRTIYSASSMTKVYVSVQAMYDKVGRLLTEKQMKENFWNTSYYFMIGDYLAMTNENAELGLSLDFYIRQLTKDFVKAGVLSWANEKTEKEKAKNKMLRNEFDKALYELFGGDSIIIECVNPYEFLKFRVEKLTKEVTISKTEEDGEIVIKITIVEQNGPYWDSSIRLFPKKYEEYIKNETPKAYLSDLLREFVEAGALSWGKRK